MRGHGEMAAQERGLSREQPAHTWVPAFRLASRTGREQRSVQAAGSWFVTAAGADYRSPG